MAKSRTELLNARLRDLQASSGDVEAAAIVSVDGLSIASSLPAGYEEDRVSAMSAAMLSLGERIATELGRGGLQQVYVKGADGYVVLFAVGEEAVDRPHPQGCAARLDLPGRRPHCAGSGTTAVNHELETSRAPCLSFIQTALQATSSSRWRK